MKRLTLGIDFDGTIVTEEFPSIGKLIPETVEFVRAAYDLGHLIIIWTARAGKYQDDVETFLRTNDIPFHYINENPEDPWAVRGEQGRKIFCDYYYDDRAVRVGDLHIMYEAIGIKTEKFPRKAILRKDLYITECDRDGYESCDYEISHFKKGSIVEVLKEIKPNAFGNKRYIIYNEDVDESTTVYDGLIEFISL